MAHIGIAGAGLLGRLLAWTLAHAGHDVEVFDPAPGPAPLHSGDGAAAWTAAGMLSPLAEQEHASAKVTALGWRSLPLWQGIVQRLGGEPFFAQRGSLLLAHGGDLGSARRVLARLTQDHDQAHPQRAPMQPQELSRAQLLNLEPALHNVTQAWLLPGEGQIHPVQTMIALHRDAPRVIWHWQSWAREMAPYTFDVHEAAPKPDNPRHTRSIRRRFDLVFDVRGVGGRPECDVRGVRGELLWLHAPGLRLTRPLRLLHPRHRVYIVPRPGDLVVIGASEIESEDTQAVTLRSAVELMAAAHSVLPELADSRLVHLEANLRPALPDHQPRLHHEPGLVCINGLFRHGWLMAPALVEQALHECGLGARPSLQEAA
ncbi:FAD-dependent oxidoreductase [Aquabacterium sp.]|uniref:FAD-dependent oxidoreductase n=1 Tax=Aquabacterium sp. TaxID=1872578 RepID=UPI0035B39446